MAKAKPALGAQQRLQRLIVRRQDTLEKEGFLPSEARFYAKWPISSPGVMQVRRHRKSVLAKADKYGISTPRARYAYITDSYKARGYITKQKTLDVDRRNAELFAQLELPAKKRTPLVIAPDRYNQYQMAEARGLSPSNAFTLAAELTPEQWRDRMRQFGYLRKSYFTTQEIVGFLTARGPRGNLQKLNLNNAYWQLLIQERRNWYAAQYKLGKSWGWSHGKTIAHIKELINDYYRRDKRRTPWDWFREVYKDLKKPQVDFIEGKKRRQAKMRKKKMPYRVTRIR